MHFQKNTFSHRMFMRSRLLAITLLLFFTFLLGSSYLAQAQIQPVPVRDGKHNKWSLILQQVQTATIVVNVRTTLVVQKIRDVQEFVSKAHSVVNHTVKNVRMVNQTILITQDINDLVQTSIEAINEPRDHDLDGQDDLYYLNKWKHIQILLAIAGEADSVWELFKNVLEDDTNIMDDKGRLTIIQDAYNDALKIKASIRIQLRRINKEIFAYQSKRREVLAFEQLFNPI